MLAWLNTMKIWKDLYDIIFTRKKKTKTVFKSTESIVWHSLGFFFSFYFICCGLNKWKVDVHWKLLWKNPHRARLLSNKNPGISIIRSGLFLHMAVHVEGRRMKANLFDPSPGTKRSRSRTETNFQFFLARAKITQMMMMMIFPFYKFITYESRKV